MSHIVRESVFKDRSFHTTTRVLGEFDTYKNARKEVARLVVAELSALNNDENITIRDINNPAYEFRGSMNHKFHTAVLWRFGSSFNLYEDYHPIKFYDIEEVL